MSSDSRRKKVVFRCVAVLLSLIAAEFGLRIYDLAQGRSVRARAHWYWGFEQDRFLGYQHRPGIDIVVRPGIHMDVNSAGFRDVEIPIEPEDPRTLVICMGESSTWGINAPDRLSTWPKKLESILRRNDETFTVLNAGLPGYTLVENLQLLQLRLLKYKPAAIVCMAMRNDFRAYAGCLQPDIDFNNYRRMFAELPKTTVNEWIMRSSLVSLLATPLRTRFEGDAFYPTKFHSQCTERGEALFRDQVALISEICRRHDVQLLWVDQPIDYRDKVAAQLRPGFEHLRKVLREELNTQKVPLLQANSIYNYKSFPLSDDVHYTTKGMYHLAELLAPQIIEQLGSE